MNKDKKQDLLKLQKQDTLGKDKKIISKYQNIIEQNSLSSCDLVKDKIYLKECNTQADKQLWKTFVHLTSSLPYRGAVGRQVKFFVMCKDMVLGMVHFTSPMAQMKLRDEYLYQRFNKKEKWEILNGIYNIETCVPTSKYSQYLTGKLLVYMMFSSEVYKTLEEKYGDRVIGFETTSLYGRSSMYNRIPFLKYLGLSDGYSAVYLDQETWKKMLEEYYQVYPKTKTNRMAPVKFQIIDKLKRYYDKKEKEFPYKYISKEYKRGIYFGYRDEKSIEDRIIEWKKRWLYNRIEYLKEK